MFPQKEDDPIVNLIEAFSVGTSRMIEGQEKRGQYALVNSEVLPKDHNGESRDVFEGMGIVFGEEADDIFVYVTLPQDWKKEPTDHSMWSKVIDSKGRTRINVFYKAAFYDRSAHMNSVRRFSCGYQPEKGWQSENYQQGNWIGAVNDMGTVVYQTEPIGPEPGHGATRDEYIAWSDARESLTKKCIGWLDENYPDWNNPLAYWD